MDEKNGIFNLPLASFTFGKEVTNLPITKENVNRPILMNQNNKNYYTSIKKKNLKQLNDFDNNNFQLGINNNYFDNNPSQNNNISTAKEEICELTFGANNNELIKEEKENIPNNNGHNNNYNNSPFKKKNYISLFIDNKGGINNSFISVVLYSIHHMKLFRKYLINDLNSDIHKNFENVKNSFLYNLREILLQIGKNKYIDINRFKQNLSTEFQNRRKFLVEQPDDPSELLFVIINAIHSYSIQFPLNEISDETCTEKCFSHKFIWLDLSRIDECKCKGTSKRLFSNHNYITDIPMKKIFNIIQMHNINLNKNNEKFVLYESNQKLFNYYTNLISGIKTNCPINGQRCPINKTFHKLHLANSPSYLIFNLEHDFNQIDDSYSYSVMNILKSLILIPSKFDIWDLFELNSKKNKNDFEFIGCILFQISKVYSCAFKNKKGLLVYYECEVNNNQNNNIVNDSSEFGNNNGFVEFVSYFDFVIFCVKNGLVPIMLFYQGCLLSQKKNNKNDNINIVNNFDDYLTKEQIISLEKICYYTDNLNNIVQIKLRRKENLISLKNMKPNNNSNLNNNILINEYMCLNCKNKNKMNSKICVKCGYNNSDYLLNIINKNNIINKKYINNITKNINNSQEKQNIKYSFMNKINNNKNIASQDNLSYNNHIILHLSKRKKICASPEVKHKDSKNIRENFNFETYENKNNINYLDLMIPYIPKKEKHNTNNMISNIINNSTKNKNIRNTLNKTEININNKNILFSNEIKLNKKKHTSSKVYNNNNLSRNYINDNNNISKMNNNHKKILSLNNNKNKKLLNESNNNAHNNNEKYEKNNNTKKRNLITRTLTSNKDFFKNKLYLNSENNQIIFRNKKFVSNINNLRKKNNKKENPNKYDNNLYNNIYNKNRDIIETEVKDFNVLKGTNFDLNNLYINSSINNDKKRIDNNLNYMNYSYNDIKYDKRRNSKNNLNENKNNYNYSKRTYNKNKKVGHIKLGTWICENCSNINVDDNIYCEICKRNKQGELKRVKTPINDKKTKIKINQNKTNNSFINNLNILEYERDNNKKKLKKDLNGFNSTKEFRKNNLNKNNSEKNNNNNFANIAQNQNFVDKKDNKKNYNNTRGNIYRAYNID